MVGAGTGGATGAVVAPAGMVGVGNWVASAVGIAVGVAVAVGEAEGVAVTVGVSVVAGAGAD
ncbi:hypothetical protein DM793_21745 [Paenarthrobacter nitroguajacolicus]|nr:hypothetical protein [Paenarthrobacter nitroguajacolicus]